jgi:hypothetical protein
MEALGGCCCSLADCLLGLIFETEDGGNTSLRNVSELLITQKTVSACLIVFVCDAILDTNFWSFTVSSRYQATVSEECEDFMSAVLSVIFVLCNSVRLSYLELFNSSINSITNPNPVCRLL